MKNISNMYYPRAIIIIILLMLSAVNLMGQLSGNNLLDFQLGNLPETDPRDLSTHYDQLNLQYRYKSVTATIRYEHFLSQTEESSYSRPTQYSLQYRNEGLDLKVGNFSEILGNGLLLRAYEIPGSVFEDQAYRVRYGFYRDLRGVALKYNGNIGYVKAIRGKTLANSLPPSLSESERRPDLTEGIETGISYFGQTAGIVVLRNTNGQLKDNFYSLLLNGNLSSLFSYNFEFAHNFGKDIQLFQLNNDARYGIYASANYSYGSFGLSAEYKNYHDLLIGSGISDAPTLVKEHKYKLLNRSIHVPQYYNETGTQIEAYYSFSRGNRILLNYARAVNLIISEYIFTEFFAELTMFPGNKNGVTLFLDYSREPVKFEDHRYAGGLSWEYVIGGRHSTNFQLEYQLVERNLFVEEVFSNIALVAGYSNSPNTSLSFTWEISSDPSRLNGDKNRNWYGIDLSHKLNPRNTLSVFVGQRRGGPACTSGVCYEVLDFEGIEFRFKTKF